jgi:hypothetical protein
MNVTATSTVAILDWLAVTGAAATPELAFVSGSSHRAVAARIRALEQAGLVRSSALLRGEPALHVLTRRGLRAAGRAELDPLAISAASFGHLLAVARVAVALRAAGEEVSDERELRARERAEGRAVASAAVGIARDGATAWHRPDLVCWRSGLPVAVEVELTVKGPERLRGIVRGWARSRLLEGVVYYARPAAARAVTTAVRHENAAAAVSVLGLEQAGELPAFASMSSFPSTT